MAIPKVLGTETEFGITIRNQPDFNPALASSQLVNSYQGGRVRVQWSFDEESPGRDARGFGYETYGLADVPSAISTVCWSVGSWLTCHVDVTGSARASGSDSAPSSMAASTSAVVPSLR